MKKQLLVLVVLILAFGLAACDAAGKTNAIAVETPVTENDLVLVAKVNDVEITQDYFFKAFELFALNIKSMYGEDVMEQDYAGQKIGTLMREDLLNSLVLGVVQKDYLTSKGITVSKDELEEAYKKYSESLKEDETQQKFNEEHQIDEKFIKSNLETQLYAKKFLEEVKSKIESTMDFESDIFKEKVAKVEAKHILVATEDEAKEILTKLKTGEDFNTLAKSLSIDTVSGEKGGDLGYFTAGQMVAPFEEAAFAMQPGEVSEPVQTEFGFHIIKVSNVIKVADLLKTEDGEKEVQIIKDTMLDKEVKKHYYEKVEALEKNYTIEKYLENTVDETELESTTTLESTTESTTETTK